MKSCCEAKRYTLYKAHAAESKPGKNTKINNYFINQRGEKNGN
jgi:hypothetical protein